jgi:hypothetical protein
MTSDASVINMSGSGPALLMCGAICLSPPVSLLGLVNHLIRHDLSVIAWQRDHHHGTPAPDAADEATFIDWLDNLQMIWVHAARRISPRPRHRTPRLARQPGR